MQHSSTTFRSYPIRVAAQQLTLIGYNIYRDGVKVNDTPVTDTKFTDKVGGAHLYNVTAVYDKGEARFSNTAEVTAAAGISEVEPPLTLPTRMLHATTFRAVVSASLTRAYTSARAKST